MSPSPKPGISGEVTRVQAVAYLQGLTGHAVGSLASLLVGGAGYWATGAIVFGFAGLVCGFLLTANGLSIYFWDLVQGHVRAEGTQEQDAADGSGRALAPPSLSAEHKAELVAGLVQVVGLIIVVSVAIEAIRRLGVERGAYLLGGLLAAGNVGVLAVRRLGR